MGQQRFALIEDNPKYPIEERYCWYWDTERPLGLNDDQSFVAVQCYAGRDPNDFVRQENMALLFTDQAEYYVVCQSCRGIYGHMQWSGSTKAPNWRQESQNQLLLHEKSKGWCEFCDLVFGNGGWSLA